MVDYDLLAAIAELAPGEDHELQASTRDTPSIVVQLCQGQDELRTKQRPAGRIAQVRQGRGLRWGLALIWTLFQTRCPERQHSVED